MEAVTIVQVKRRCVLKSVGARVVRSESQDIFQVDLIGLTDEVDMETEGKEVKIIDIFFLEDINRLGRNSNCFKHYTLIL